MDNPILKILRFLIFFPICFIAMAIVNWSLGHLLIWFIGLSKFWFIVVFIFLGGTIWGLFKMLASLLVMLAAYISPIKWLGTLTISILALINGGILGYNLWNLKEDYSSWEIFGAVVATILVLELTFALINGAAAASEEHY
ncbi:MAG: hypothetical protein FJX80_07315 [Bacteroidetes bacterium]|nr:hypothetical protein [Bacteroidota bacterium]